MPRPLPCLLGAIALAAALPAFAAEPGPLTLTLGALPETPAANQQWIDQAKHPTSWLTWGADERMRIEYVHNGITLNQHAPGHDLDFGRFRTRLWATVAPCKEFEIYTRLTWEWREWIAPESKPDQDWQYVAFDNLYAKVRPMPNLELTVGRQDIILGDGWLVLEGTPLDGSTTIYFDALRATYTAKDINTTFQGIVINQYASPDVWLPTLNDSDRYQIEQNERGAILYVTNKSLKNTQVDGYFIYKHDQAITPPAPNPVKPGVKYSDQGDIYAPGVRLVHNFDEHLVGRVEGAYEFGQKNGNNLSAYGANSRLTYNFKDNNKNSVWFNFEYLSGRKAGSGTDNQFDPLWGRWPQFSEFYVYSYAGETRIAETTNLLRFGPGYSVYPCEKVQLEFTYNALFANENPLGGTTGFSSNGYFRGNLFTAILRYKMNDHLSAHLWGEYFDPGSYYDGTKGDSGVYLRAEVILTF